MGRQVDPPGDTVKLVSGTQPGWSALFSDDDLYRYMLNRPIPWGPSALRLPAGCVLASCGLNPSKADAFRNDQTVSKELAFGRMWGCDLYVKVNAYAWRDTRPESMFLAEKSGQDIIGNDITGYPAVGNDQSIVSALFMVKRFGGIALAAWGNHVTKARANRLSDLARDVGVEWWCLGVNNNGSPKHSLYPSYATPLVRWLS